VSTTIQPPILQASVLALETYMLEAAEDTETKLKKLLSVALQVEFSTIPPYLTAMYSIQDKTSRAYQLTRSVVMEEMLHLNLVSNLLNAVGGQPTLVVRQPAPGEAKFPPDYPVKLSEDAQGGGPYLQLMVMSRQLVRETFMRIEQPAQPDAPPEAEHFSTIGQLYLAIKGLFKEYQGEYRTANQSADWNFGNNGGTVIKVEDEITAIQAINEIIEQGEGADLIDADNHDPRYHIMQRWGQYEYYGPRTDGTYGPVLGTPLELSHYFKFKEIVDGTAPLPATYPMVPNPSVKKFNNPLAKELGGLFDMSYSLLVDQLQDALRGEKEKFFTSVVPLMRVPLPVLATQLMQVPIAEDNQPYTSVDPTAGPPFSYSVGADLKKLKERAGKLADDVAKGIYHSASTTLVAALRKIQNNL
jgi:rubrerythrin